jgi:arylsulfatase A-like enzyme
MFSRVFLSALLCALCGPSFAADRPNLSGIRVPAIAWWPGTVKAGVESRHVGYFGDWFATACELAGAAVPAGLDSISFVGALRGKPVEQKRHDFLYWEFHERGFSQAALYLGRWKGIRERTPDAPIRVYDLQADPGEQTDLAAKSPEIAAIIDAYLKTARSVSGDWPIKRPPTGDGGSGGPRPSARRQNP